MDKEARFAAMASRYHYTSKETAKSEYHYIQCSLKPYFFSFAEWSEAIRAGHPVRPSVLEGGRCAANFKQAQVLGVDFDNAYESVDENGIKHKRALRDGEVGYIYRTKALARCRDYGITPMLAYSSLSDAPDWPRYRLMFYLARPIEDVGEFDAVMTGLRSLFPESDRACTDPGRFYLGSNGEVFDLWKKAGFEPTDPEVIKSIKPWDGGRIEAEIAKRLGRSSTIRATNTPKRGGFKNRKKRGLKPGEIHVDTLDLLGQLEHDAGEIKRVTDKYITFKTCPICGHHDCLVYRREKNRWQCYSTWHDNGGNIVAWIADREGISYKEAKTRLGEFIG